MGQPVCLYRGEKPPLPELSSKAQGMWIETSFTFLFLPPSECPRARSEGEAGERGLSDIWPGGAVPQSQMCPGKQTGAAQPRRGHGQLVDAEMSSWWVWVEVNPTEGKACFQESLDHLKLSQPCRLPFLLFMGFGVLFSFCLFFHHTRGFTFIQSCAFFSTSPDYASIRNLHFYFAMQCEARVSLVFLSWIISCLQITH